MGSTELPFTFVNTEEDILELQIYFLKCTFFAFKKYAAALNDHQSAFVRICYIMQLRIIGSLYVYEHTS